ncbi:MAG: hypothetical protein K2X82_29555 [Gemmataceae bacterium]|nr:hypothetical protein [Gemmataceae bacterium]
MRAWVGVVAAVVVAAGAVAAPAPKGAGRANPDEVRKRVFRCWLRVRAETAGRATEDPTDLCGVAITPRGTSYWLRRGELAASPIEPGMQVLVDPSTDPMRIDYVSTIDGARWVTPGIFRFEAGRLEIVQPNDPGSARFREDGNYPIRPTGFTCTKENKYGKEVLIECGMYDQD